MSDLPGYDAWKLSCNPADEQPIESDEDRVLCGCGDPRCWLLGTDTTNVQVNGQWFAADCCGLCWPCGQVDALTKLVKLGGSYLAHEGCVSHVPIVVEGLERATADDLRDDYMEKVRR